MSGDYSRKTFDPRRHFDAVRMQQGRVQLDADWNEESDIQDRRWRAETVDVIGRCGCPDETPEAFHVENDGGALTIGIGRTYVHGLLAESFGEPPLEFDRILAEERGTLPVPYLTQPYLPNAADLLDQVAAGPVLVYLDVWQREVTYLEDPELVEVAVGVDTTARRQTVWQVRLLGEVGAIDCSTADADIPGWLPIITPSGGRLSSRGAGVADPMDPCLIPPSGGYRGLENRLYRVEIHDPGAGSPGGGGPATFKWSRYNATVATAVTAIPELDTLRVERTGRDDVLRFDAGDWVEVIDDHLELAGLPGVIRRVDSVDDGTRTIVLRDDLPAGVFPVDAQDQTLPGRHTRIRRWDQSGVVRDTGGNVLEDLDDPTSAGVIPLPADGTSLILEDGVEITFDSDVAGGPVRTGDFWCFAARHADASVEELDTAPPEGIHHHHCRLAVAEFDGDQFVGDPSDCRTCFPPLTEVDDEVGEGCCTVVVRPGESLQDALDSLPPEGGCVCVKTGVHVVAQPLRIAGSNVVLHGESPGSIIRRQEGVTVLVISNPTGAPLVDVEIRDLRLECAERGGEGDLAIVVVDRCNELTIADCEMGPDTFAQLIGIRLGSVLGGRIERCAIGPVFIGLWVDSDSTELDLLDNTFTADFADGLDRGIVAIWMDDAFGASRIERNRIRNFALGIRVNRGLFADVPPSSGAHGTRVVANTVVRQTRQGSTDGDHAFGIDVAALDCLVAENVLSYGAAFHGGIRLTGGRGCVEKNRLSSAFEIAAGGALPPLGIQLGFASEAASLPAERSVVRGNRLTGPQDAIVVLEAEEPQVAGNEIGGSGAGGQDPVRLGIRLANVRGAEVVGNRITGATVAIHISDGEENRASGNAISRGLAAIMASNENSLIVADNRIDDASGPGILGLTLTGPTAITGNRVRSCGYQVFAFGIGVLQAFGEVRMVGNEVVDTGVSRDETQIQQPALGLIALLVLESLIEGNLVVQTNPGLEGRDLGQEDRALLAQGLLDFQITDSFTLGYPIQILDNNFTGPGRSHLVELRQTASPSDNLFLRFERVAFSDNVCWHWVEEAAEGLATVLLRGRRAVVANNQLKATNFRPGVDFNGIIGTYLGNDAGGRHPIHFTAFPAPLTNFNR